MRTIIAGGRDFDDLPWMALCLDELQQHGWSITEVVSGVAKGADITGEEWAHDTEISIKQFPADWETNGKAAGPIRNTKMADYAEALVAFWDGNSRGTKHMIDTAVKKGLYVKVFLYEEIT